jgi:hypothetical protein
MGFLNPFQQRTRVMQSNLNRWMARQSLQKRQIGLGVCTLDYVVKVADRLVRVHEKDKLKFHHRETSLKHHQNNSDWHTAQRPFGGIAA